MFSPAIIVLAAFGFVTVAFVIGGMFLGGRANTEIEDRLDLLTQKHRGPGKQNEVPTLFQGLNNTKSFAEDFFNQFGDVKQYLEQGGVKLSPTQFLVLTMVGASLGAGLVLLLGFPLLLLPVAAMVLGAIPLGYVWFKRKRRLAKFGAQLPEALELISRALRAGHSLAAGFNLVGDEMAEPIRLEFARCYEEQNLGIPLEDAIQGMTNRVPNLDLKFFATAVVLQRQTGGDLAEILDKIGHLVRERFKIWGQIQALTGEGRLSGIVLLSLPPVLFVVMYKLNPDYTMVLFRDELGKKMLAFAVVTQLIGAYVIKKIIDIKV